jgi:glycosyltransferase involved in cell wall biosynthesis
MVSARAKAITAVSDATALSISDFSSVGRGRVITIHNAVDVGELSAVRVDLRAELDLPAETVLVGAVGRLAEQKGWWDFVEVADHLAGTDTRVHIVIAGEGPQGQELRQKVEGVSWADRCHFLGPRPDGAAVIAGLDLFLMTSLHEELPTTVLEAFAVGTPVVGFLPEGGMADILSAAGDDEIAVILTSRDSKAQAVAASELLDDPEKRRKMTVAARLLVERTFDARSIARQYAELYRTVAGSRPGD